MADALLHDTGWPEIDISIPPVLEEFSATRRKTIGRIYRNCIAQRT